MKISTGYQKIDLVEGVTIEVRPMSALDYQTVIPLLADVIEQGELEGAARIRLFGDQRILDHAKNLFDIYTRNFDGVELEDENGLVRKATVQDLWEIPQLLGLAFSVLSSLCNVSTVSDRTALKK